MSRQAKDAGICSQTWLASGIIADQSWMYLQRRMLVNDRGRQCRAVPKASTRRMQIITHGNLRQLCVFAYNSGLRRMQRLS